MRNANNGKLWVGFLAAVLAGGCGPSVEAIVDEHRASVEHNLAHVSAVAGRLAAAELDAGIGFEGHTLDFQLGEPGSLSPTWNAGVVHEERLVDIGGVPVELGLVISELYFLAHARDSLDGEWWSMADDPQTVESEFQKVSQLRYLFVVRTVQHKMPRSVEGESFIGGHFEGETLCFDLESGSMLGGFAFQAENSDQRSFSYTTSSSNVYGNRGIKKLRAIHDDLLTNAQRAFWDGVSRMCPNAMLPRKWLESGPGGR